MESLLQECYNTNRKIGICVLGNCLMCKVDIGGGAKQL